MSPGFPDGAAVAWDRLAAELPEWAWPPPPSAWLEPVTTAGTDDVHPAHGPFVWQASGAVKPTSGPLAGLRLAVKDLVAVAGRPCRAGSASRQSVPPEGNTHPSWLGCSTVVLTWWAPPSCTSSPSE